MSLLIFSPDLIFASQLRASAEQEGIACTLCLNIHEAISAASQTSFQLAVVDLSNNAADIERFVECSQKVNHAESRLIAFGPHVHHEKRMWAGTLGFDLVMTRGEITRRTTEILAALRPK